MSARTVVLCIVGFSFAMAAPIAAKPPGLPADPHSDGRERTPVEIEFYTAARAASPLGFFTFWPTDRKSRPMTPAELETWRGLNRLPADLLGLALPPLAWY